MALPGLSQLENSPEMFRLLLDGISIEEAGWKPSPKSWSIAEIIAHLSHVEGHCFRARIDSMLNEDTPAIEEYDQEMVAASGQYAGRDVEDSFDHWEEQRETNLEHLRGLPESILTRPGLHERLGIITIADLLNAWAFHDL